MKHWLFIFSTLALFLTSCVEDETYYGGNNNYAEYMGNNSSNGLILDWNNLAYTVDSHGNKRSLICVPNCSYVVYKIADEEKLFTKLRDIGLTVNEEWIGGEDLEWNTGIYADTRRLYRLDGIEPAELNAMDEVVYASNLAFYENHLLPLVEAVRIIADIHAAKLMKLASYCKVECLYEDAGGTSCLCLLTKQSTINSVEFIHLCKDNGMDYVLQPYIQMLYPSDWIFNIYPPKWSSDLYEWFYQQFGDEGYPTNL